MYAFGQYLLRKPVHAAWVILVCTLVPYMGWLASVMLGLVTLCKPVKDSAIALSVLVLANVGYAYWLIAYDNAWVVASVSFISAAIAGGVFLWGMGLLLRYYRRWAAVFMLIITLGLPLFLVANIYLFDIESVMSQWLDDGMMQALLAIDGILTFHQKANFIHAWARLYQHLFLPGIAEYLIGCSIVLLFYTASVGQLLVARWWQAHLFVNAIRLRVELLQIRMPWLLSVVCIASLTVLFFMNTTVLFGVLPIVAIAWLIAGLSVLHAILDQRKLAWLCLLLVYIGLFAANRWVIPLVLLIACVDSFIDLRKRIGTTIST